MTAFDQDVTLVTQARFAGDETVDAMAAKVAAEDRLLADALAERGLSSRRVAWSDGAVDWSRTRVALLRATWDYFERLGEFTAWLDRVARRTTLINPPDLVRWNLDKRYLADLERAGLPVTPTRFVARGSGTALADVLAATGWGEVVVKPAVSASGWETHRVDDAPGFEERFRALTRRHDLLVQPFLPGVLEQGELSCVVVGGQVTHAVRKRAARGRFLVQAEHGGSVEDHAASEAQRSLAEAAVAALPRRPAYARVDLVPGGAGAWLIGELELIEPELWLRRHPPAAQALAGAVEATLRAARGGRGQR